MGINAGLGARPCRGPMSLLPLPASKCKFPCDPDSLTDGETFYFILATVHSMKRASNSKTIFSKFTLWVLKDANDLKKKNLPLKSDVLGSVSSGADAALSIYCHTRDVSAEYSSTCHATSSRTKTTCTVFT